MIVLTTIAFASDLPPRTHRLERRDTVVLDARDGTDLHTVIIRPRSEDPVPTIVTRVPYGMDVVLDWQCRLLARRGYACVYQHVRGRGRSEGEWNPFVNEEHDGQDTIAWVEAQPWSNGRVAWLGDSYLAAAGWTVALEDPDGLDTLVSRIFAPSLYTSAYEDGLLRHELVTVWMTLMPDRRNRLLVSHDYHAALKHRPRTTLDLVAAGHEVTWYREWLEAEDPTHDRWAGEAAQRFQQAAEHTTIPVMMVGGWSDAFVAAQIDVWASLASRDESLLVIGPWAHLGQAPSAIPLREDGGRTAALQNDRVLDWLDTHVRGAEPRYPQRGAITYVVGGDRWEMREDWPPPTVERRFGVAAGTDRCDGTLAEGAVLATPLAYTYDPEDPLRSRGGDGMLAGAVPFLNGVPPGFVRSPDHCRRRDDVLRFTSAPLAEPLHLAGRIRVELEVASDAEDTAFGFRLLEHRKNGTEFLLREGFATLTFRDGPPRTPYTPGSTARIVADAGPLEAEIQPGSELVLVITSSSFPSYEAHPNVAGLLSAAETTRVARQQVHAATLVIPEVVPYEPYFTLQP